MRRWTSTVSPATRLRQAASMYSDPSRPLTSTPTRASGPLERDVRYPSEREPAEIDRSGLPHDVGLRQEHHPFGPGRLAAWLHYLHATSDGFPAEPLVKRHKPLLAQEGAAIGAD